MLLLPNLLMVMNPAGLDEVKPPCYFHVLLCGKPLNPLINPHGGFIFTEIIFICVI